MVPSPLLSSFPVQCDLNGNYLHKIYFSAFECTYISHRFKAWSLFSVLSHLVKSDFMILLFLFGLYFWINAFSIYFEYFRSIRILIRDSVLNVCLCFQLIIRTLFRHVLSMYILNWIETNTVEDFGFWNHLAMLFTKGWKGRSLVSFMTNLGFCLPINQLNVGHHEMQFRGD